jgi:hypothetical protein
MRAQNTATEQRQISQQLGEAELEIVVGGLNPQPLPPSPPPEPMIRILR